MSTSTLNTKAVNVLTEVLRDHGITLADEYGRLTSMFTDYLHGDCREEHDLLMLGQRYGVVRALTKAGSKCDASVLAAISTQFQHETKYLTFEAAHFAVHGWSYAISSSSLPKNPKPQAPIKLGTPQQRTLFATAVCCVMSVGLVFMLDTWRDPSDILEEQLLADSYSETASSAAESTEKDTPVIATPKVVASPPDPIVVSPAATATTEVEQTRTVLPTTVSPPAVVRQPTPMKTIPPVRPRSASPKPLTAFEKAAWQKLLAEAESGQPSCNPNESQSEFHESAAGVDPPRGDPPPQPRLARRTVPKKAQAISIRALKEARLMESGVTFDYPRLTLLPGGDIIFLDQYQLLWNHSSGTFDTSQKWVAEPVWIKFGKSAFGMLTDSGDGLFEVTMYYAHQQYRIIECYTGFRNEQALFKLVWAFEGQPGKAGQWYYLGKSRSSLFTEHLEYFAESMPYSKGARHDLIRKFFSRHTPRQFIQKLMASH